MKSIKKPEMPKITVPKIAMPQLTKVQIGKDDDFNISFSLKKDEEYNAITPLGILDFEGKYENAFFAFDYSLIQSNVDSLEFKVLNENGNILYAITNIAGVVISATKNPLLALFDKSFII